MKQIEVFPVNMPPNCREQDDVHHMPHQPDFSINLILSRRSAVTIGAGAGFPRLPGSLCCRFLLSCSGDLDRRLPLDLDLDLGRRPAPRY